MAAVGKPSGNVSLAASVDWTSLGKAAGIESMTAGSSLDKGSGKDGSHDCDEAIRCQKTFIA